MIRVSLGTAGVMGLRSVAQDDPPTTAYLMLGERCSRRCGFCAQARGASGRADSLSRVTWPSFSLEVVVTELCSAAARGRFKRVCLQVVTPAGLTETVLSVKGCSLPVCVCCFLPSMTRVGELLEAGAEGVTLPLDAASAPIYRQVKGGSLEAALARLREAARAFPGRIGTHLIVGLGETEEEMITLLQLLHDAGVRVGLFAFTPLPETAMGHLPPPPLAAYRRVQAAHYLIRHGLARAEEFGFAGGNLVSFGRQWRHPESIRRAIGDGEAFRTSGCPDCNRPYYNERPGTVPYNYPRPLSRQEAERELALLLRAVGTRCPGVKDEEGYGVATDSR